MPYTPTVFVQGMTPGISATELNKLGTGVQTAAAEADTAVSAAIAAAALVTTATTAFSVGYRRVRTSDSAPVTSSTLSSDGALNVVVSNVPSGAFLVKAALFYTADAVAGGQVALFAYNGLPTRHATTAGGIAAYTYAENPVTTYVSPSVVAWDYITAALVTLDGADTVPQATQLASVVVNGNTNGDVVIGIAACVPSPGAVAFQLLAGSYLTVEQLT